LKGELLQPLQPLQPLQLFMPLQLLKAHFPKLVVKKLISPTKA
jgi:hypothetical protein